MHNRYVIILTRVLRIINIAALVVLLDTGAEMERASGCGTRPGRRIETIWVSDSHSKPRGGSGGGRTKIKNRGAKIAGTP